MPYPRRIDYLKRYMYLLSIVSCSILTYLFISRGQYLPAAFVATVAILYTAGIVIDAMRKRKLNLEKADQSVSAPVAPVDATVNELLELLKRYTKNLRIFRNATITIALISVMIAFVNESLAVTFAIVGLVTLFKLYQNYRAVRLIKKGLAEHID